MEKTKLNLRTLIPVAAGSAIMALGCSTEHAAARKYCKTWQECDEKSFDRQYESLSQCTKTYTKFAKARLYDLKVTESADCAKASRDYMKCSADSLNCDYWDDSDRWYEEHGDDCEAEYDKANELCYDYDYDYYY